MDSSIYINFVYDRYPSGNNNTASVSPNNHHLPKCSFKKSSSLPNIKETLKELSQSSRLDNQQQCHTSRIKNLPLCHVPESTNCLQNESVIHLSTIDCNTTSTSTEQKVTQQPAFNLVKLFIQQKSSSTDTCMDVSSGCWPSTDGSSNSSMEKNHLKKKIMNDSGKSSSISRHDDKDLAENDDQSFQLDSLDICDKNLTGSKKGAVNHKPLSEISPKIQVKNPHICNIINNNYFRNQTLDDNKRLDLSVNMMAKSIQTSSYSQSRLKFVPPSFLANLNKLGEEKKAPVYVIYPNYALPDLNFVHSTSSDIFFTPYKLPSVKQNVSTLLKAQDEDMILTNIKSNHIKDWKSLITLLPAKYRKKLKQIPEANVDMDLSLKPMFCMSPPIKRNKMEICDCLQYLKQQTINSSSSGSSEKPPSSGYRGSSTMMTDSGLNNSNFPA